MPQWNSDSKNMWFPHLPVAPVHIPHLMLTLNKNMHLVSGIHTSFPTLPHFWTKNMKIQVRQDITHVDC